MHSTQPSFDELHIVSDIHLGGVSPGQIFDQGQELAALIDHLAGSKAPDVGLVLNGDIVDFLAEPGPQYLDPQGAVTKLERIIEDPAFSPVWKALARFVSTQGRTLVLVLGNHDVELALPAVRERLCGELCGPSSAARGRLVLAMDGAGYACQVGGRSVLCLHGNEVDEFNVVDYRALLDLMRSQNRRQPLRDWSPNAGTKLVIDIMNPIKRMYPFVDLLKPETRAVPAVLLALDPSLLKRLTGFASVAMGLARDATRMSTGFLSAPSEEELAEQGGGQTGPDALEQMLRGDEAPSSTPDVVDVDDLLDSVEDDVRQNRPVRAGPEGGPATLGVGRWVTDVLLKRDPRENLRLSLQKWLGDEQTFATDTPDTTYTKLDESVSGSVDFLVAGHTHLMRAIRRPDGGAYFNSGTWIRLIRLNPELLGTDAAFAAVFDALKAGSMDALDRLTGLVLRRPTVVSIKDNGRGAVGELNRVALHNGNAKLTPVEGTSLEMLG